MSERIEAFYARELKRFEMQLRRSGELPQDKDRILLPDSQGIGVVSQGSRRASHGGNFERYPNLNSKSK